MRRSYATSLDADIKTERRLELVQKFIKFRNHKRKYIHLRKYNITPEEFLSLKKKQDNCCAICKKRLEGGRKTHLDHNHYTGKVRGILCSRCNLGLGNFKDDITSLENAIKYLRENDG